MRVRRDLSSLLSKVLQIMVVKSLSALLVQWPVYSEITTGFGTPRLVSISVYFGRYRRKWYAIFCHNNHSTKMKLERLWEE